MLIYGEVVLKVDSESLLKGNIYKFVFETVLSFGKVLLVVIPKKTKRYILRKSVRLN